MNSRTQTQTTLSFIGMGLLGLTAPIQAQLIESTGTIVASFDVGDRDSGSTGDYEVNAVSSEGILHTDGLYITGQSGAWTLMTESGNGQNTFGPVVGTDSQSGSDITFTYAAAGEKIQHNNQTAFTPPRRSFWRVIGTFGEPPVSFTISGLSNDKAYDLIFYAGGEQQQFSRFAEVTINGVTPFADADGDSNFTEVTPTNGVISGVLVPSINANGNICRLGAVQIAELPASGPFQLLIKRRSQDPGRFDFKWGSRANRVYDLVSTTDPSIPIENWTVWDGFAGVTSTPPLNTLSNVSGGTEGKRFFAVIERDDD